MEELTSSFDESVKFSALSKVKHLRNSAKCVKRNVNKERKQNLLETSIDNTSLQPKSDSFLTGHKLYAESEKLRKQEVLKAVINRSRFYQEEDLRQAKELEQIRRKSSAEQQERVNQQVKIFTHELLNIELQAKKENALLEEQQRVQEKKRTEDALRMQKHLEQQRIKILDALLQYQAEFREELKGIYQDDARNETVPKYSTKLHEFSENMEKILTDFNARIGQKDAACVEEAAATVAKIKELRKIITAEIAELKVSRDREELKKKEEELKIANEKRQNEISKAAAAAEAKKKQEDEAKQTTTTAPETVNTQSYHNTYRTYKKLKDFLKKYEESYQRLLKDEKCKKYRFDCQKAINMPINAITAVSGAHLTDKFNRLERFLSGQTVEIGNTNVSIGQHPEAVAYCTDLLAKKFVRQGDLTVSSNPQSAFAFAAVIVALWTEFPDFGKLVLAHFHKECVYLVPTYPVQAEGQTNEEYYKALGYKYSEGVVETHDKFLKRMTGIVRLYSAVIVTKQRRARQNVPNPHGLKFGWCWLASVLNLEPRIDITATLLFNFLDVAGNALLISYGRQFKKIIAFIYEIYYPRMEKIDSGGPVVRFQVFLNDIIKSGRIHAPEGMVPDNFW